MRRPLSAVILVATLAAALLVASPAAAAPVAAYAVVPASTVVPASAAAASPAPAAVTRTLPPDETLLGLSCDWNRGSDRLELSALDPATGVGTRIGISPESEIYFCAFSMAWDSVPDSCTAFHVGRGPDDPTALMRTDLRTGFSSLVAPVTLDGARVWASSMAIDSAGSAWALYDNRLHRLDLATGVLTPVVTISGASVLEMAFNPSDGQFYVADGGSVFRLDPTTGATTVVLTPDLSRGGGAPRIEGIAFDGDGTLWITAMTSASLGLEIFEAEHELWSATLGGEPEFAGLISSRSEGVTIATMALAVVPRVGCASLPTLALEPAAAPVPLLAATGLEDASPVLVPVALAVLAVGLLLVSFARRARQAVARHRGSRREAR